ncbi:MAG: glycosyltransferase [bacterium]
MISERPHPAAAAAERVAAFVVTYRRPVLLADTLRGVLGQTHPPDAVIVINNDAADDVRARLAGEFPGVEVVDLASNEGSGGGFACALDLAARLGYTWSWLLDDDSIPEPASLEALLGALSHIRSAERPVAMAASTQLSPYGSFGGARWRHRIVVVPPVERSGSAPFSIDVAYWAGLMVHRSVMERIGLPRADFFRCFADYEYCLRVRRAAMEIIAVPASRVAHHNGMYRTVTRLGRTSVRLVYSPSRHYYSTRNEAYTAWRILRNPLAVFFHLTRQARLALGDILHEDQRLRRLRLRALGTLDGLRGRLGQRGDLE